MHKMIEYIDNELMEAERKASNGRLSNGELERADMLAHLKKSILTNEAMEGSSYDYNHSGERFRNSANRMHSYGDSYGDESYDGRGRGANARRDSMGRYSSDNRETIDKLYTLMERIPDLPSREVIKQIIKDMER